MEEQECQQLRKLKEKIRNNPEMWSRLSPRERDFLRLRVGLDDEQFRELSAIAQLYGVTIARIRSIETKALRKMGEPNNPGSDGAGASITRRPCIPGDLSTMASMHKDEEEK